MSPTFLESLVKNPAWRFADRWWLHGIIVAAVILGVATSPTVLLFSVLVSGVACVALAAKGRVLNYIVGIYNSAAYAYVSWHDHLYGEVMLNVCFFIPMGVVGLFMWRRHLENHVVIMKGMTSKQTLAAAFAIAAATLVYGIILAHVPKQNTPYIDSLNVVLSIAATILMVARYKEQWLLYIILNITTVIMWAIRAINDSASAWTMIIMWSIFLANACYGYLKWSIGAHRAHAQAPVESAPATTTAPAAQTPAQ
jgi:nicotinamide mononucleotide transporter